MLQNRWINISRRLYARLLKLYPQDHYAEYGDLMLQLFSDLCQDAYRSQGIWGLLVLWPRTLFDQCINGVREHLAHPNAKFGLIESVPNHPLPWKGVVLVLIPGLVFLVAQYGQLTGKNWFFWATRHSGFFLIIPVLLVWIIKRKFPVWG